MKTSRIIILSVMVSAALTGCHSSRDASGGAAQSYNRPALTLNDRYTSLTESYTAWSDAYIPVTLSVKSPQSMSVSGRATMIRGKEIHMSFRILGIEVAALYINEDSVFAVDKYHKYMFAESLDRVLAGYRLTVNDLQDLLLGRGFLPGDGTLSKSMRDRFNLVEESSSWALYPKKSLRDIKWHYTASLGQESSLTALIVKPKNRAEAICRFSGPTTTLAGTVAESMSIEAPLGQKEARATIKWNLNGSKWNTGRTISWSMPKGYQKLSAENIQNLFKLQ